ncbi:S1 family peptidase [Rhodococcus jostii]|uniref:S1 family peptidase n=1 Tax=Rhodococcus jostii TaxID=132919 RepID=UPI001F074A17|nr:S1 family peptidase [Rhodococcus jostii]
MRTVYGLLACLAVTLGVYLVNVPAASATGVVSNGIAWTDDLNPVPHPPGIIEFCTMGVVGTDFLGNKIGISAAHCVDDAPDGAPVYRYAPTGPREHIGNIVYRSPGGGTGVDWVVIRLNADAVLTSNGPSARVDGIGAPNPVGPHCKDGAGTGVHCGAITSQNTTRFYSNAQSGGGDSGGPVLQNNTEIVGMVRGFDTALFAFEYIKFAAVLDGINAQPNPVGRGFVVTNN